MLPRLGQVLDFQSQALLLRAERQRLIASNIANADTPGYQAREMDFAQALREATAGVAPAGTVVRTAPGHIAPTASSGGERHLRWAAASQTSLDGNTVDMDRERASFADNAVKYEATLRFINGSVRTMLDAIKGQSQ
jgi:flagellar basal-body rod protein FlgB